MTARRPVGDDSCDPAAAAADREIGDRDEAPSRREPLAIDAIRAKPRRRDRSQRKKPPGLY